MKRWKKRKFWYKLIGGLLGTFLLFMGIVFVVNLISTASEQKNIALYGQYVEVDGKRMNVFIQGDGEETIVLLPGQGTPAPALDFKLLIDELSPDYKIVAIEPFGYGLSDRTDKERTTAHIIAEIHEAVEQLGLERYLLMGHSIAGLYGISYVQAYPEEVLAFVGIDSSVPNQPGMDVKLPLRSMQFLQQSGLMRLVKKLSGNPYDSLPFDAQTKEQMNLIANRVTSNPTMINELEHLGSNFNNGAPLSYPAELPVLLFVQSNNEHNEQWVPLHEDQANQSMQGRMIPMEGSHYLHHTKYKEIADAFRTYMNDIKQPD